MTAYAAQDLSSGGPINPEPCVAQDLSSGGSHRSAGSSGLSLLGPRISGSGLLAGSQGSAVLCDAPQPGRFRDSSLAMPAAKAARAAGVV